MNKTEFVEKLADECDLTKTKSQEIVSAIFDTDPGSGIIATELDAGRKVQIPGFGTWSTKHRSSRKGRNPATGEEITIPAKDYPAFKAGKGLKDRVEK
ncbi:MAG: HU family DNA-binding protein [Thermoanaerobaculia bacterium]|nr:HU family DNA-binding protein [Thermoanaerobaculia bacterium]